MQIIRSGLDGIEVQLWEAITRYQTRISENGLRGRIEMRILYSNYRQGGFLPYIGIFFPCFANIAMFKDFQGCR